MDPKTIMMLIMQAGEMLSGAMGGEAPEGAGLPAADSGAGNIFGENTQAKLPTFMLDLISAIGLLGRQRWERFQRRWSKIIFFT